MNVLLINGHPRKNSLSTALMNSYLEGVREGGIECKVLFVTELQFNLHVTHCTPHQQELEPSIVEAQELILWAQHIVFIYPTWWGTMPALLKGFIDRVFTSGFAFEETEAGIGYEPLLKGKTAEILTTMDTPALVYQFIYRAPGHNAMRRAILEFSGINVTKILSFGPVKSSGQSKRDTWLYKTMLQGAGLKNGPF